METPTRRIALCVYLILLGLGQLSSVRSEGVEFLIEVRAEAPTGRETGKAVQEHVVAALQRRVDRQGLDGVVEPAGEERVLVRLFDPGIRGKECAHSLLQRGGSLEFRMVHPNSERYVDPRTGTLLQTPLEPGYEVLTRKPRTGESRQETEALAVKKSPERGLTGSYITHTLVTRGRFGEPELNFELSTAGSEVFAEVTRNNIGRRLAIVVDGELYSAPVIRGEIPSGRGLISGQSDVREAQELAVLLESPLGARARIVEERGVAPEIERRHQHEQWQKLALKAAVALAVTGLAAGAIIYLTRQQRGRLSKATSRVVPPRLR
jgi:protein-export membrane protein SecD